MIIDYTVEISPIGRADSFNLIESKFLPELVSFNFTSRVELARLAKEANFNE